MSRPLAALLALIAAGCSVDRSVLDDRIFECRSDEDCIDGYGCELVNATAAGFCAEKVDEARDCDGYRTVDGFCLPQCAPGSADACGADLDCVSAELSTGDVGYCVPEATCTSDDDCSEDEACLSTVIRSLIGIFGQHEFGPPPTLTCVPLCGEDGDECPAGMDCVLGVWCMPKCGDDSECPLGFGCSSGVGSSVGLCLPGIPWLITNIKCRDQSNCLVGRCTTFPITGSNDTVSYCAQPCDDDPLCNAGTIVDGKLNIRTCRMIPDVGPQCAFLSGYWGVCDPQRVDGQPNVDCVTGLTCQRVTDAQNRNYDVCLKPCTYDETDPDLDRNGDCTDDAFCFPYDEQGNGVCAYDLPVGIACERNEQCASRNCDMAAACEDKGEAPGCCAPAT